MAARTRAKDSDRDATCRILDDALGDGQLSGEEHRRRVATAVAATTLGELEPLVADLQLVTGVQQRPSGATRSRGPILAVAGVVAVAIVAVGWGLAKDDSPAPAGKPSPAVPVPEEHVVLDTVVAPAPDTVPPAVLKPVGDLLTAEGLTAVIDAIRARFGDTMGYELAISTDRATLARPDPADDRSKMLYPFRGGWDDPSQRQRSDTDDLTDLAAFDIPATAAALATAPATLNIAPGDVASVDLDIDHLVDEGALELLVKIVTTSGSAGYLYLDPAAKVKRVENPG
ncbi:MAG: DUF1707 domain-containing protein [Mycolicibacterium cosmeticum]|nr:DUF1707 domain-containing protein [Mycolicibacterium cosmeticum]